MSTAKEHQYEAVAWPASSEPQAAAGTGPTGTECMRGDRPQTNFRSASESSRRLRLHSAALDCTTAAPKACFTHIKLYCVCFAGMKCGVSHGADGSAEVALGKTRVIAVV